MIISIARTISEDIASEVHERRSDSFQSRLFSVAACFPITLQTSLVCAKNNWCIKYISTSFPEVASLIVSVVSKKSSGFRVLVSTWSSHRTYFLVIQNLHCSGIYAKWALLICFNNWINSLSSDCFSKVTRCVNVPLTVVGEFSFTTIIYVHCKGERSYFPKNTSERRKNMDRTSRTDKMRSNGGEITLKHSYLSLNTSTALHS